MTCLIILLFVLVVVVVSLIYYLFSRPVKGERLNSLQTNQDMKHAQVLQITDTEIIFHALSTEGFHLQVPAPDKSHFVGTHRARCRLSLLYQGTVFTVMEQNVFINELRLPVPSSVLAVFGYSWVQTDRRACIRAILNTLDDKLLH